MGLQKNIRLHPRCHGAEAKVEEDRLRFAELFLELVKLWNKD